MVKCPVQQPGGLDLYISSHLGQMITRNLDASDSLL